MTAALVCPSCGVAALGGDAFCESCGAPLEATVTATAPCAACGGQVDGDGYCTECGRRSVANDRVTVSAGRAVGVSDRGRRHHRNEDAMAVLAGDLGTAMIACDGVSSSSNPDLASRAAADAAAQVLQVALDGADPGDWAPVLTQAVSAAQIAASLVEATEGPEPPSTTLVAAVVTGDRIITANIGDSRAYWLAAPDRESGPASGERSRAAGVSRQLTVDDSWAEEAISAGADPIVAMAAPEAHTITRWLAADSDGLPPSVGVFDRPGPGWLVVCTDGLWNYVADPADLAELAAACSGDPAKLADHALTCGGRDNITVVVVPFDLPAAAPASNSDPGPDS